MGVVRRWGTKAPRNQEKRFFSAEFQLENPRIYFQFRLRETDDDPMFVLVQKDSQAVGCLVQGAAIPMTFHFEDNDIPAEQRMTRISSIKPADALGLENHLIISLSIQTA